MPCYHPLHGYRSRSINPTGKRNIVFNQSEGYKDFPVSVPCGQCIGCRLERSRQWAIRCVHEASLHETNSFITLTYSPEHIPKDNSLVLKHYQDFMKRLRFTFDHEDNNDLGIVQKNIRFFHCGEYGEESARPHYHACLFNCDFPDKVLAPWRRRPGANPLYVSPTLARLWPNGIHSVGNLTFQSAAYVARYITKKISGGDALLHYNTIDSRGEILAERKPEYVTMSRRPGIGNGWFKKYKGDVYPHDFVILNEKKLKPPKYYDRLLEREDALLLEKIKSQRATLAQLQIENNNAIRLDVREKIQLEKFKRLKRSYEINET